MNRCAAAGRRDWLHDSDGAWNMLTLFFTVLGAAFGVGQGLYLVWKDAVSLCGLERLCPRTALRVPTFVAAVLLHGSWAIIRLSVQEQQTNTRRPRPTSPPPPLSPPNWSLPPGTAPSGDTLKPHPYVH